MNNKNPKINAVENSLRYKIQIAGSTKQPMTLMKRMAYYEAPGVSIAVINQGKLAWAKGYGHVGFSTGSKNIDNQTLFQSGSISKSLNAMGALILVQKGLVELDKDVNQYLKSWKIPDNEFTKEEKVTLRRLLSHTAGTSVSGFPGYPVKTKIPNLIDILEGKKPEVNTDPVRVIQKPGSEFMYSGGGTTIVQLLIEDIVEQKYDVWMQKNVLLPLNMNQSTFNQPLTEQQSLFNVACGHSDQAKQVDGNWHVYPEMAAAGLWTTPIDLANFMIELFKILNNQPGILDLSMMQEAITPQIKIENGCGSNILGGGIGLGFFLEGNSKTINFSQDGMNEGFIGRFIAFPEEEKGLVIMVNNDTCFGLIDEITFSITDAYGIPGFEPIEKSEISPIDTKQFREFCGTYQYQDDKLTITMHGDKLFFSYPYTKEMQLHKEEDHLFFVQEISDTLRFIKLDNGTCKVSIINNGKETIYLKSTSF